MMMNRQMQNATSVTVIGAGPMGQAMSKLLLGAGKSVMVWNRSAGKTDALASLGAGIATSVPAAVKDSSLIILSLTDYKAMYSILDAADTALRGRTVVNLSSGTPMEARAASAAVEEKGARFLCGGVMSPPAMLGTKDVSTFYSGSQLAFDENRHILEILSAVDFRGEDPGLAQVHYQAHMAVFWTSAVSFLQAVAMADAYGVSPAEILPGAENSMATMPYFLRLCADHIESGTYPGDADRLSMGLASIEHVVDTCVANGVDARLPAAIMSLFEEGVQDGFGESSYSSIMEVLRRK